MGELLGLLDAVVNVGWISFGVAAVVALGLLILDRRRPPRVPGL